MQRHVQLHSIRRAKLAVVVAQHAAATEAAPLVERDGVAVARLDVELCGPYRGVRGGQFHRAAEQLGAYGAGQAVVRSEREVTEVLQ